jgi:hypothetical protein
MSGGMRACRSQTTRARPSPGSPPSRCSERSSSIVRLGSCPTRTTAPSSRPTPLEPWPSFGRPRSAPPMGKRRQARLHARRVACVWRVPRPLRRMRSIARAVRTTSPADVRPAAGRSRYRRHGIAAGAAGACAPERVESQKVESRPQQRRSRACRVVVHFLLSVGLLSRPRSGRYARSTASRRRNAIRMGKSVAAPHTSAAAAKPPATSHQSPGCVTAWAKCRAK